MTQVRKRSGGKRTELTLAERASRLTKTTTRSLRRQATILGIAIGTLWGVFAVNAVLGHALFVFGIVPRTVDGLRGILFAPFLHANTAHLVANSIPFLFLGWLVMLRDRRHFLTVTLLGALGAGLVAWLLGAPGSVHIGASGVVFGYLGFLLLSGWFARSVSSVVISVVVAWVYGTVLLGVVPGQQGVSWQGHLGGFIGGALAAWWLRSES